MKTKDGSYDPIFRSYVERMAEELRKLPKRPASTTQCASTQATLDRPVEQDLSHWLRPIPATWKAKEIEERKITPDEFDTYRSMQHSVKRHSFGKEEHESSVTPESKEKAIHAFTYSEPAPLTTSQIQQAKDNELTAITTHAPTIEDVNAMPIKYTPKTWDIAQTWWNKFWGKVSMKNIRDKK